MTRRLRATTSVALLALAGCCGVSTERLWQEVVGIAVVGSEMHLATATRVRQSMFCGLRTETGLWFDAGFLSTRDGGRTAVRRGLDAGRPTSILMQPGDPPTLWIGTEDRGLWRTVGDCFHQVHAESIPKDARTAVLPLDPANPARVVVWIAGHRDRDWTFLGDASRFVETLDDGATWAEHEPEDPPGDLRGSDRARPFIRDPLDAQRLFDVGWDFLGSGSLMESRDGGATWHVLDPRPASTIAFGQRDGRRVLWVGGRGLTPWTIPLDDGP